MDEEQQRERADLLSRLFAMITMKPKNAAGIAAECQGKRPLEELRDGAHKLDVLITAVGIVLVGITISRRNQ